MRFATVTQIVVMTVVFCAVLFALDYWKNPQLWHAETVAAKTANAKHGVRLTLWMNQLCCTECLDDLRQALQAIPALDVANAVTPKGLMTVAQANQQKGPLPEYGNSVEFPVINLDQLDLVAVDRALRDKGVAVARMEISGVEHYRFEATLDHICCGACGDRATSEKIDFLKAQGAGGQFKWLDSLNIDHDNGKIVAYARYLQPGSSVNASEFISGLNDAGIAPKSVHVLTGDEHVHEHHARRNAGPAAETDLTQMAAKCGAD
jgi:hypothetical protein